MLNVLRENFKQTPYLKWVLAVVGIGLIMYLGNYFVGGSGASPTSWAAKVNGVEISDRRFRDEARATEQYYRQVLGSNYDQFRQNIQIGRQAVQRLIEQELILQDARRLGLESTKEELAEAIRTDQNFQDPVSGQFIGTDRYRELVERAYGSAAAYEGRVADQLVEQRWTGLVTQAVGVADEELRDAFRRRTEKTSLRYVVVPSAGRDVDTSVDDAELQRWYDEHPDDFKRSESRRIRYVVVRRDDQRSKVQVGDDEIRAYYDANQPSYQHEEQHRARHILFKVPAQAADAEKQRARGRAVETLERLRRGEDFAALARSLSEDTASAEQDGDLGFFGRGQMVQAFEDAAFATPVGEIAPLTESPFGFHVIQVTDSRPAGTTPLDQVADTIRQTLEEHAAQEAVQAEAVRLREAIGSAERLEEVAKQEGLEVQTRTVGLRERLTDIGASPDFSVAIAGLGPGEISRPLSVAAGAALATVDETLPAARQPLAEATEEVRKAILEDRRHRAALATARQALGSSSTSFQDVAAALKLEPQEMPEVSPGQPIQGAGGNVPEVEQALFSESARVGDRGAIEVPAGALVYEITERRLFDPQAFESQKGELRNDLLVQKRAGYRQSLLAQLEESQQVEINQEMLARVE